MLKRLKLAGTIAALALATTAVPALGADSSPFPRGELSGMFWSTGMMSRMDTNKDGMVSRDEYMTYMGKQFDMMDSGKKKMLTSQQFTDKKMMALTFPASGE